MASITYNSIDFADYGFDVHEGPDRIYPDIDYEVIGFPSRTSGVAGMVYVGKTKPYPMKISGAVSGHMSYSCSIEGNDTEAACTAADGEWIGTPVTLAANLASIYAQLGQKPAGANYATLVLPDGTSKNAVFVEFKHEKITAPYVAVELTFIIIPGE